MHKKAKVHKHLSNRACRWLQDWDTDFSYVRERPIQSKADTAAHPSASDQQEKPQPLQLSATRVGLAAAGSASHWAASASWNPVELSKVLTLVDGWAPKTSAMVNRSYPEFIYVFNNETAFKNKTTENKFGFIVALFVSRMKRNMRDKRDLVSLLFILNGSSFEMTAGWCSMWVTSWHTVALELLVSPGPHTLESCLFYILT